MQSPQYMPFTRVFASLRCITQVVVQVPTVLAPGRGPPSAFTDVHGRTRKGTSAHARDPRKATQTLPPSGRPVRGAHRGPDVRHGMAVARGPRCGPAARHRPRARMRLPRPRLHGPRCPPLRPGAARRDHRRPHGPLVVDQPARGTGGPRHRRPGALRREPAGGRRRPRAGRLRPGRHPARPGGGHPHPLVAAGGPLLPRGARRTPAQPGLGAVSYTHL